MKLADWLGRLRSPAELPNDWPQLRDRVVIGTFRGRSAVTLACRMLGIGAGHEVLVPAYNCGTELDALIAAGVRTVGYRITRQCDIDLDDLVARRTGRTRAVYLIHYFGWEQPMAPLRRWCDEQGLFLIEDCALALFSSGASGALGRTGDAAVFSLPKTLGSWHGGLLSLSGSGVVESPRLVSAGSYTLFKEMWHSAKATIFRGLDSLGLYGALHSTRRRSRANRPRPDTEVGFPAMPGSYYFNPDLDAERGIHPRTFALAGSLDREEIVRRRCRNYQRLAGALGEIQGVRPLHSELPAGVCPLSFPLLVADRDRCVEALQSRGIAALPWWAGFHRGAVDWAQFPEACGLKRELLTLPIHPGLDDGHLVYMVEVAARVLKSENRDHCPV